MGVAVGEGVGVCVGVAVEVAVGLGVGEGVADRVGEAVAVTVDVGLSVAQALGSADPPTLAARLEGGAAGSDGRSTWLGGVCGDGVPMVSSAQSPKPMPPRISAANQALPMGRRQSIMRGGSWLTIGDLPPMPSWDIILGRLLSSRYK
jgi:hypothetical protein